VPKKRAILLVGPTGSGKSPLGNILEKKENAPHVDFGYELRASLHSSHSVFSSDDLLFIREMLEAKALLPKERFDIAKKVLRVVLEGCDARTLILNGFPRAVYHAEQIESLIDVVCVVELICSDEVVYERIGRRRRAESEDHSGRDDDRDEDVKKKLEIYRAETHLLIDYYRKKDVTVISLIVGPKSCAVDLYLQLKEKMTHQVD